jgi:hypothetical protein
MFCRCQAPSQQMLDLTLDRFAIATKRLKIHKKRVDRRASSVESAALISAISPQSSVLRHPPSFACEMLDPWSSKKLLVAKTAINGF